MNTKDAYIRQLENQISMLQKQIDNLIELILIMRQDKFGAFSEARGYFRKNCFMITSHPEEATMPWNFSKDSMDISIPTAIPVTTNWKISRGAAAGRTSDGSLWRLLQERRHLVRRLLPQKQAGITAISSSGLRIIKRPKKAMVFHSQDNRIGERWQCQFCSVYFTECIASSTFSLSFLIICIIMLFPAFKPEWLLHPSDYNSFITLCPKDLLKILKIIIAQKKKI